MTAATDAVHDSFGEKIPVKGVAVRAHVVFDQGEVGNGFGLITTSD